MKSRALQLMVLRMTFGAECWVSLHSGDPEQGNEVSYQGYARVSAMFDVVGGGETQYAVNVAELRFADCVGQVRVTHVGINDGPQGGLRYWQELSEPFEVGDRVRPEFGSGTIVIVER